MTHGDDPNIPKNFAAITMDDNGFVGTNNGYPFAGQPALFPIDQACAICYAWNGFAIKGMAEMIPNPEAMSEDILRWLK
jgi:hypothetical protein